MKGMLEQIGGDFQAPSDALKILPDSIARSRHDFMSAIGLDTTEFTDIADQILPFK